MHQFMKNVSTLEIGGKSVKITQKTAYPENGKVQITVKGSDLSALVCPVVDKAGKLCYNG